MQRRILALLFILSLQIFIFSACGQKKTQDTPIPEREATAYDEKLVSCDDAPWVDITLDTGLVEVYSWDRYEVKFEVAKKVKGSQVQLLENKLKSNFIVSVDSREKNKIEYKGRYLGRTRGVSEGWTELRLFIPKKMVSLGIKLDSGRIKLYDDLKCSLEVRMKSGAAEINRLIGTLAFDAEKADIWMGSGKLYPGSYAKTGNGNVYIKSECENTGRISFETAMGNVELHFPEGSPLMVESSGSLVKNDFEKVAQGAKCSVKSGMGDITIIKY